MFKVYIKRLNSTKKFLKMTNIECFNNLMIPISICGIDDVVNINFFNKVTVLKIQEISDYIFLTINSNPQNYQIQLHKNFWKIIKRNTQIDKIIEQ